MNEIISILITKIDFNLLINLINITKSLNRMPSQFQQAQSNLSNLTQPEYRYVAIWGFEHLLTNGSVKRLDEHNISYVQLKPAHLTQMTNDYETDYE
jgi:hypothetical protein